MHKNFPFLPGPQRNAVRFPLAAVAVVLIGLFAQPASTASLTPLTSFGGGDGWLAPGESGYTHLTTNDNQRGIAYGNGHLYLVDKTTGVNSVQILDPNSGADIGSLDTSTVISGGTFAVDSIAVGGDGVIYVGNLTTQSTTSPFKVYKWATEASTPPVLAYSGDAGLAGARMGDDLAAIGSGSSTRLVTGYGSNPSVAGNNGYSIIDPTAGTATAVAFAGTPPNAGDFRLGITFTDSSHVLGTQGSGFYQYTSFSGASGTLLASPTLTFPGGATAERLMAYTVIGGYPILAVQSTGDSHVSVYLASDPAAPVWLTSGRNVSGTATANVNGTGALAWGTTTVNGDGSISQILYGMSTNQGIQAFTLTLEAPPTIAGDYNYDGHVDAADYIVWRSTLGRPAVQVGSGADGNGNGTVGDEDYIYWQERFGNPPGSTAGQSATIPEPSAWMLALLALAWRISRVHRGRAAGG